MASGNNKQANLLELQHLSAGIKAHHNHDLDAAKRSYIEVLKVNPSNTDAIFNLGSIAVAEKRFSDAVMAFAKVVAINPAYKDADRAYAIALAQSGQYELAALSFEKHLGASGKMDAAATSLYYIALFENQQYAKLEKLLTAAHRDGSLRGDHLPLYIDTLITLSRPDDALAAALACATREGYDEATVLACTGKAYRALGNITQSLLCMEKFTAIKPDDANGWGNYGYALSLAGRDHDAALAFRNALALAPLNADLHIKLGHFHRRIGNRDTSVAHLEKALEIAPFNADAHYHLCLTYGHFGEYQKAWVHYDWMWKTPRPNFKRPPANIRPWHGETLQDKTLLVYADQGLGDSIQHIAMLPLVVERCAPAHIVILGEKRLEPLIGKSLPHGATYIAYEDADAHGSLHADYVIPLCSLPAALDIDLAQMEWRGPGITAKTPRNYRRKDGELVIGLSWYSRNTESGPKRSIPLADFAFLGALDNVRVIDLQYGDTSAERAACGFDVFHDDSVDALASMQDFVDQVAGCDLVISIDNTTVHVAGALGTPVWTILSSEPYWRWPATGQASPWYPSMKLYRQDKDADYTNVLARIKTDVTALAHGDSAVLVPAKLKPAKTVQTRRAVLINDTFAWYHWGCNATSMALRNNIAAKGYDVFSILHQEVAMTPLRAPQIRDFDDPAYLAAWRERDPSLFTAIQRSEVVVFNGEGTIHGLYDNALRLMYLAYVSKTVFHKPVHIINHACFPQDSLVLDDPNIVAYYLKAYRAADYVAVRDAYSHQLLSALGIANTLSFDSLPLTARDWMKEHKNPKSNTGDTVLFAGSSRFSPNATQALTHILKHVRALGLKPQILLGAPLKPAGDDKTFIESMRAADPDIEIVNAVSLHDWFTRMLDARLLISGRFHYTIAAACVGLPFIAFEGNTPKLDALCEVLGAPAPLTYDTGGLAAILEKRADQLLAGEKRIDRKATLIKLCEMAEKNFSAL